MRKSPANSGAFFHMYRYMIDIFNEIPWSQFAKFPHVVKLPLHEQMQHYNQYLEELSVARLNWITYQNKGQLLPSIQNIGFLAQEESFINNKDETDYYLILQEDGSAIYVTALI